MDQSNEIHGIVGAIVEEIVKNIINKKCNSNELDDEEAESIEGFQASEVTDQTEMKDMIATVLKKHDRGSMSFLYEGIYALL